MFTAKYVSEQVDIMKKQGMNLMEIAWKIALLCIGWAYVFGARGEYCDPPNRRSRARDDHPTIKSACKNFNGSDKVLGACETCKWYPGGRTRFFDCRGFIYWILKLVYGFVLKGAGATTQWNNAENWSSKGEIAEMPKDTLVCLFVKKGKTMEHTGFGYNNETIECSAGVQHFTKRNKKWTHWAVPACVTGAVQIPETEPASTGTPTLTYPTVRKGNKGDAVVELQSLLAKTGSSLTVDGIFGNGTLTAVKAFQTKNGLAVDGVVGPKTWQKLLEVTGNIQIPEHKDEYAGKLHTLIIPDLTEEEAFELTAKYPRAVPVEIDDVQDFIS